MSDEPKKPKWVFRVAAVVAFVLLGVLISELAIWVRHSSSPEVDVDREHERLIVPVRGEPWPYELRCTGDPRWSEYNRKR